MSLVTEDVIINFSPVFRRCTFRMAFFRPWVAEKQHTEMFSMANFLLSKNFLVMKRFVLNTVLLKNDFRVVI